MSVFIHSGNRYFITFINRHSHNLVMKLLKMKDKAFTCTKEYLERAENKTGRQANFFRRY
ncbi:hypothetical protein SERLA73DRAFT_45213 [Serpula lacrymans var. lacrymans S7.3]|uniref:Uncharacterized protein n=1 Tax=Serpula lacrymans var. lacrymans (strain S7.3) TaxID=936435 RepID=F8PG75_SERL3|nr:hypothetical protein SERLA73DRAFT_45213 [Serpula lacrymans var. lacrymans S7.3]